MDYSEALRFLDRHVNLEATAGRVHGLSLDAMRGLVACMGDPQQDVPTIHVTGTNGKSSVAAMTVSLLGALGLRRSGRSALEGDLLVVQSPLRHLGQSAGGRRHQRRAAHRPRLWRHRGRRWGR